MHARVAHATEKRFTCTQCDFKGVTKTAVIMHMRSHDPTNKFSCEICDGQFQTKPGYLRHVAMHKSSLQYNGNTFSCPIDGCYRITQKPCALYAHMRHHHKIDTEKIKREVGK